MCLKSSFVYKINAYRGTTTFKKMLSFEVDSLEDNLSWTISGSVLLSQRMLPFQELKEGLPKKCDLRRPSNDTDLQTCLCVCVCVCVCVYDRRRERDWRWGWKRGERIRYEIIIAIWIAIVLNLHVTASSTLPALAHWASQNIS